MSDQPRKIAIVGTAEPHWRGAPFDDPSWEIWTCGGIFATVPRTDRHFELHDKRETCKGWGGGGAEQEAAARAVYWEWISQQGPRAVLKGSTAEAPDATVYPLDSVLSAFHDRYFTNSVSWMVALALVEGCTELGLWGIDMAMTGDPEVPASNEYSLQRPSVEFYLGIAVGAGIKLHLPEDTTLLKARKLYAFDDGEDGFLAAAKAKIMELRQKKMEGKRLVDAKRRELIEAEMYVAQMNTGLEIAGYMKRNMEH